MVFKTATGILEDVFRIALVTGVSAQFRSLHECLHSSARYRSVCTVPLVTGVSAQFRSFPRLIVDITAYCLYRQTEAVGRYVPRR
jgi:hypothetical protein